MLAGSRMRTYNHNISVNEEINIMFFSYNVLVVSEMYVWRIFTQTSVRLFQP